MVNKPQTEYLSAGEVTQIKQILKKIVAEGKHWIDGMPKTDWRKAHYGSSRIRRQGNGVPKTGPSTAQLAWDDQVLFDYISKAASAMTEEAHHYFLVCADKGCDREGGLALVRPVLKLNKDNQPQLNFHVWFHCMLGANPNDHLMTGWRLEGPEGSSTTHNFFHAQPLRKFVGVSYGMPDRFSERFPTIPMPASNIIELCLTAVLVASGMSAVNELARHSASNDVRVAAQAFHDKIVKRTQ